jgi:tyrosine-protein phosphatase non-receptor type 9
LNSSEETQKNGVILLVDMGGSGLANLDRKLSQSILALLQEGYPARLKMIYIIDAPWWFRTAMAFILPFLKKKTRDRIWISNRTEILRIFKSNSLPKQLGGDLDHDHLKWLQKCTDHYQIQQAKRAAVVKNSTMSSIDTHLVRDTESNMATSPGMLTSSRDETLPLPPVRSSSTGKKPAPQRSPDRPPKRQHGEDAITPPVPDKPEIDAPPLPPKDLEIYSDEDHALNITGFEAYFKEKGREGIFRDYAVIRLEKPAGNFDTSSHPVNAAKNRYADVLCLEHSRVKLTVIDEDDFSDYINANFVDSFKQPKAYIFTQGPLRNTFNDFWRMVWEQQTQIIIMTTKLWERGRMKCGQYWPDVEKTTEYGELAIMNVQERVEQDYTVRVFIVHKGTDSRAITQYQFTGWPDFGVPPSAQSLLKFLSDIHALQDQHSQELGTDEPLPPMVMHCSAGIGRTGTLGAVDIAIQQLTLTGKVNLEGIVRKMRCQRAHSIQTPEQYEFCFRAIIEWSKTSSAMKTE